MDISQNCSEINDMIEENYNSSCEDENLDEIIYSQENVASKRQKRCPNRTGAQLNLLKSFASSMSNNPAGIPSSDFKSSAWEVITSQLNAIGPPTHTDKEWRKVWAEHKSKAKSKKITEEDEKDHEKEHQDHLDLPCDNEIMSNVFSVVVQQKMIKDQVQNMVTILSDLQKKLDTVIEQQKISNKDIQKIYRIFKSKYQFD